ncbi:MAG: lipoyl synthase [Phycisphaerales bacterium]|nr:lipoyl synthase [Phycisphaerales bacterium]
MSTGSVNLPVINAESAPRKRLPSWLKKRLPPGDELMKTQELVRGLKLTTVCVEARCPNLVECWSRGTATFMILGDRCTRRCGFCAINTQKPLPVEIDEPQRLADAAAHLGLRHVVITSVARDDLPDEGATHFANCITAVRHKLPQSTVEVLVPDFHGKRELIKIVTDARPEVFNHNIETVARLQKAARPAARYERTMDVLRIAKELCSQIQTKSGLMVGLGETRDEIRATLRDLRDAGCDMLTIGQYLKPGDGHLEVNRYYTPQEFDELGEEARDMGFSAVASGPFVRSSYFAETLFAETDYLRVASAANSA